MTLEEMAEVAFGRLLALKVTAPPFGTGVKHETAPWNVCPSCQTVWKSNKKLAEGERVPVLYELIMEQFGTHAGIRQFALLWTLCLGCSQTRVFALARIAPELVPNAMLLLQKAMDGNGG